MNETELDNFESNLGFVFQFFEDKPNHAFHFRLRNKFSLNFHLGNHVRLNLAAAYNFSSPNKAFEYRYAIHDSYTNQKIAEEKVTFSASSAELLVLGVSYVF